MANDSLLHRNALIAGGVVLLHVAALWALQSGLLQRTVERVVPVTMVSEMLAPTPARVDPPPAPLPVPARPTMAHKTPARAPAPAPAPKPQAIADPTPAALAPSGVLASEPPAPEPPAAAVTARAEPVAPPPPTAVQLPSSDADYLQNPRPAYPPISKRLGEQGRVMLRVLIGADGTAKQAEVRQSSGYPRLDQAALDTVLKWRYVPGKRAGVAEAMWFNVPINFVLE